MPTVMYGCSDDLVEIDGQVREEFDIGDRGAEVMFSDGTLVKVQYGLHVSGSWGMTVVIRGDKIMDMEFCHDPDSDNYTDRIRFADGLKWARLLRGSHD